MYFLLHFKQSPRLTKMLTIQTFVLPYNQTPTKRVPKMLLRNNLFHFDKPKDFDTMSISRLMRGLVFDFDDPYIPFFTPIGTTMLNNIENVFRTHFDSINCYEIQIPLIMSNNSLKSGQEIGALFEKKIMHLSRNMKDYHLMTSPEMVFVNLFSRNSIDSNAMPINYYYISNIFRDMPDPKNILRTKQIRIFGGVSFDKTKEMREQTERNLTDALYQSFVDFGVPFHKERFSNGASSEFFYLNSKENETYMIPSIDNKHRTKSISLGMIYDYSAECPKDLFHINPITNTKEKTFITSYAVGLQRVMYMIMDHFRDSKGFNLPAHIRPCDVVFVSGQQNADIVEKMAFELSKNKINVYIDNVYGRTHIKRMDNADYIGTGLKVVSRPDGHFVFDRAGNMTTKSTEPQEIVKAVIDQIAKQRTK